MTRRRTVAGDLKAMAACNRRHPSGPPCMAHLSGSGLSNIGALCRKPSSGTVPGIGGDPSPRCPYHMGVEARREARRNAPHVHKAWQSTTIGRPDGTMAAWCANCGALMFDTSRPVGGIEQYQAEDR